MLSTVPISLLEWNGQISFHQKLVCKQTLRFVKVFIVFFESDGNYTREIHITFELAET